MRMPFVLTRNNAARPHAQPISIGDKTLSSMDKVIVTRADLEDVRQAEVRARRRGLCSCGGL